jgi:predicted MFS family arabinose efflux permease
LLTLVRVSAAAAARHDGVWRFVRQRDTARPTMTLLSIAIAAGICTSLLPLVHGWAGSRMLAAALLAHSLGAVAARGASGFISDPAGLRRLIAAGVLLTTTGLVALSMASEPVLLVASMAMLGVGFGIVQNPTFVLLLNSADRSASANVSVVWNFAYDAGFGVGGVIFGGMASVIGSGPTLAVIACLTLFLLVRGNGARRAYGADTCRSAEAPALAHAGCN